MTFLMLDDANVAQFSGLVNYAFAGYVDNYKTFPWIVANRPQAKKLSITLYGNIADALDVEPGGATNTMGPGHFNRWHANRSAMHTTKPVLYTMAGNSAALIGSMSHAGINRSNYLLWSAHVGRGEHICSPSVCGYPQADATQWSWTYLGRSLDVTLANDIFFGNSPNPTPVGTKNLEDNMLVIDSTTVEVPLAFPVGSNWLTFFSAAGKVLLDVTLEGGAKQSITVSPNTSVTLAVNNKRGARLYRTGGDKVGYGIAVA